MTYQKLVNTFFIGMLFMTACSHSVEMEKIEELRQQLVLVDEAMNLDLQLFEERKKRIEKNLLTIRQLYNEDVTPEFASQMERYKALKKIYAKNINIYHQADKDRKALSKQLTDMQQDLRNFKMSKEEFKKYFRVEKQAVADVLEKSSVLNKQFYEVEPEYIRLEKVVEPLIAQLLENKEE